MIIMYEIFAKLLKERGLKLIDVSRGTGIPYSTFTDWKAGRYTPKTDKLQKIADYFGVSLEYLTTGTEQNAPYYLNDETRELAQFLFKNPNYKVMFDAVRKVKPEDMDFIREMIDRASR